MSWFARAIAAISVEPSVRNRLVGRDFTSCQIATI